MIIMTFLHCWEVQILAATVAAGAFTGDKDKPLKHRVPPVADLVSTRSLQLLLGHLPAGPTRRTEVPPPRAHLVLSTALRASTVCIHTSLQSYMSMLYMYCIHYHTCSHSRLYSYRHAYIDSEQITQI
jgi:hypothetical protein